MSKSIEKPRKTYGYELPDGRFVKKEDALTWLRRQALTKILHDAVESNEDLKEAFDWSDPHDHITVLATKGAEIVKAFQEAEKDLD